jgi:hypothetical protein
MLLLIVSKENASLYTVCCWCCLDIFFIWPLVLLSGVKKAWEEKEGKESKGMAAQLSWRERGSKSETA